MIENRHLSALIEALARQAVDDYLTGQAAPGNDSDAERPQPPALSDVDQAA